MTRPLRIFHPGTVYETSIRTTQGRHLLAPSPEASELMLGVLGRALSRSPAIRLHAFAFLPDEFTMLLSADRGDAIPAFANYVHSNLARELGALHDWPGPFWATRYRAAPVLDEESMVARFRHVLGCGVAEGLVTAPRESPWPSALRALLDGGAVGVWFCRNREYRDRRVGRGFDRYQHAIRYPVQLAPLPCWVELDEDERRAQVEAIAADLETDVAIVAALDRGRPKPPLPTDPHARPSRVPRDCGPVCHAATLDLWYSFRGYSRRIGALFRSAAARLRTTARSIAELAFPPGTFPPRLPHVVADSPLPRILVAGPSRTSGAG